MKCTLQSLNTSQLFSWALRPCTPCSAEQIPTMCPAAPLVQTKQWDGDIWKSFCQAMPAHFVHYLYMKLKLLIAAPSCIESWNQIQCLTDHLNLPVNTPSLNTVFCTLELCLWKFTTPLSVSLRVKKRSMLISVQLFTDQMHITSC